MRSRGPMPQQEHRKIFERQAEKIAGGKNKLQALRRPHNCKINSRNASFCMGLLYNDSTLSCDKGRYEITGTASQLDAVQKRLRQGETRLMKWDADFHKTDRLGNLKERGSGKKQGPKEPLPEIRKGLKPMW